MKALRWSFAFALVLASTALAVPEYVPIQERAQGQSLTGANLLNDSLYSNPASSTFTQVYAVDANMQSTRNFAASILDTKTSSIGGALGYFRRESVPGSDKLIQGVRLGLASRVEDWIGVGFTGKMLWGYDPLGREAKLTDMDLGILANWNVLQTGVVLRNAFGGNREMDNLREVGVGVRVNYQNALFLSSSAFSRQGLKPHQIGFGAEYVSPYYFAVKGGYYFRPNTPVSSWTGGLSFVSPRMSLHYAAELPNDAGRSVEHQFGMTMLF